MLVVVSIVVVVLVLVLVRARMRELVWLATQRLSKHYVESIHWYGYRTTQPVGLGFHLVKHRLWTGRVIYSYVE